MAPNALLAPKAMLTIAHFRRRPEARKKRKIIDSHRDAYVIIKTSLPYRVNFLCVNRVSSVGGLTYPDATAGRALISRHSNESLSDCFLGKTLRIFCVAGAWGDENES